MKPTPSPNHTQNPVPRPLATCPHFSTYTCTTWIPPPALSSALPSPKRAYIHPPRALLKPFLRTLQPSAFAVDSHQPEPSALLPALLRPKSIYGFPHAKILHHHHPSSVPTMLRYQSLSPQHSKITVLYRETKYPNGPNPSSICYPPSPSSAPTPITSSPASSSNIVASCFHSHASESCSNNNNYSSWEQSSHNMCSHGAALDFKHCLPGWESWDRWFFLFKSTKPIIVI